MNPEPIIPDEHALLMRNLRKIFDEACFAPSFKSNTKYPAKGCPRIAYSDVMNRIFAVRDCQDSEASDFWDDTSAPLLAEYKSLDESVKDGWTLD